MNKNIKSENTKYMVVVKKKDYLKYVHIALIILGAIFVLLSNFHTSIWFDESYSVGISSHNISEIWSIGSNDVHPVLYYIILHNIIWGEWYMRKFLLVLSVLLFAVNA